MNRQDRNYRGYRIIALFWKGAFQASITPKIGTGRVSGASVEDALAAARKLVDAEIGYPRRERKPRNFRHTQCHHCKMPLSSEGSKECSDCGWLICECEACGCKPLT